LSDLQEGMQTEAIVVDEAIAKKAILYVYTKAKPITKLIVIGITEGRTHTEIGLSLNMSSDGVKKRLATFRRNVKEVLECT